MSELSDQEPKRYPASSGFSRPDATLRRERNHFEHPSASLIEPPSGAMWIIYSYLLTLSNVGEPNGVEFQGIISKFKSEKKNKFRRCLFKLSIKRKIRHLHVVVVQKWQRNAKIKAWCTCKVVVLLIKPIVLLKFSLPSCRWIFVVITWTRMLDGKANGCSQWFLSHRSVASGLEKPQLAG